jgi:hypothetical protein
MKKSTALLLAGGLLAAIAGTAWAVQKVVRDEVGPQTCGGDDAVRTVACTGRFCDDVHLTCERVPAFTAIAPSTSTWTDYFSEEGTNYRFCWNGVELGVITGMQCTGSYCDNHRLQCSQLVFTSGRVNDSTCFWSEEISEEFGRAIAQPPAGFYATGMMCTGRFCDNLRFHFCRIDPR